MGLKDQEWPRYIEKKKRFLKLYLLVYPFRVHLVHRRFVVVAAYDFQHQSVARRGQPSLAFATKIPWAAQTTRSAVRESIILIHYHFLSARDWQNLEVIWNIKRLIKQVQDFYCEYELRKLRYTRLSEKERKKKSLRARGRGKIYGALSNEI